MRGSSGERVRSALQVLPAGAIAASDTLPFEGRCRMARVASVFVLIAATSLAAMSCDEDADPESAHADAASDSNAPDAEAGADADADVDSAPEDSSTDADANADVADAGSDATSDGDALADAAEEGDAGATLGVMSIAALVAELPQKNFLLINVHVPYAGEIPGTDKNLDYQNVPSIEAFIGPNKQSAVVVYCYSNSMALSAGNALVGDGYANVRYVDGGLAAWKNAGHPVEFHDY